ncbi:hypothetical protein FACS1894151_01170 [Spirochaetia bacterium]|nr:hypothetical protein FACS1894151_01170 [Spirochaetia bacterium]
MDKLVEKFDEKDENATYWTDEVKVYFRHYEIKGADIETFEHYFGCWAKDKKNCYLGSNKIKDVNKETFTILNSTYAKDDFNVWTLGGKIKEVDAKTFEVCDNGKYSLGKNYKKITETEGIYYELFVPYGFGKDKNNVYYYDFNGKPNIVKNALPETFVSLNDGFFGYDEKNVFCKINKLNKADPKTWKIIKSGYYYSKDKILYYFNRIIKDADPETFEVIEKIQKIGLPLQLAKDKNNYYLNDRIITKEEMGNYINK